MRFKITIHTRSGAPADALERLLQRLGERRGDVFFSKAAAAISALWRAETPISMRDERSEIGRRAVWEIVREVCEGVPDLKEDWFAVSPQA